MSVHLRRGMQELPSAQVAVLFTELRAGLTAWSIFSEKSQPRLKRIHSETGHINLNNQAIPFLLFTLCDSHKPHNCLTDRF